MTNSTKKMTKRERFTALLNLEAVKNDAEMTAFIEHEIELLDNKRLSASTGERKLTPKQVENETIKEAMLEVMEPNRLYTITELIKVTPNVPEDMANQRMSALVAQCVTAGKIERVMDKRKALFRLCL